MSLYKKCTAIPHSFLENDTTPTSDNPSRFRWNLSKIIKKAIVTIDDKVKYEKLQYHINREPAEVSALS